MSFLWTLSKSTAIINLPEGSGSSYLYKCGHFSIFSWVFSCPKVRQQHNDRREIKIWEGNQVLGAFSFFSCEFYMVLIHFSKLPLFRSFKWQTTKNTSTYHHWRHLFFFADGGGSTPRCHRSGVIWSFGTLEDCLRWTGRGCRYSSMNPGPPQRRLFFCSGSTPEVQHSTWKIMVGRLLSYWV